jgi:hypothetical protein
MTSPTPQPRAGNGLNPFRLLLRLFSSIRFGIILLALLFVYSSIGSAGIWIPWVGFIPVRQFPVFEMTEFEWFHWWPFDLLIALICITLTVATLRRIRFKPVNYGVWMIHSGIIILAIGSVIYFSTKVEGDAPVIRRSVVIELPTGESASIEAIPGNQIVIGDGPDAYTARISNIDPEWEILSGDDKGKRAYAISVSMQPRTGDRFVRQLLVGYPQYTEDTIPTGDPQQPFARAIKQIGKRLADESITIRVDYEPQRYFYLAANITKCFALYVRPLGEKEWTERPIDGMPMFNDFISSTSEVWMEPGDAIPLRTLDLAVPAAQERDPLPGAVRVTSYLRYAVLEERKLPGGDKLDPVVAIRLRKPGHPTEEYTLTALDPQRNSEARGQLQFRWIESAEALEELAKIVQPALIWTDPETGEDRELVITEVTRFSKDAPFLPIEGTAYSYRVESIENDLEIVPGRRASIVSVEVKTPERSFRRWVSTDPSFNRDMPIAPANPHVAMPDMHEQVLPFDEGLQLAFKPGKRPAPVTLIAGPKETDFGLLLAAAGGEPGYQPLVNGQIAQLPQGITLEVIRYAARTRSETRPFVVPGAQRDRDATIHNSMVKVEVPGTDGTRSYWVPYHHWPFEDANETMRRFRYRPVVVEGSDGGKYEMILSRQRLPLPNPVVLEDFELTTQLGGFTGNNLSVRDWTSVVRFRDDESWTQPMAVSVNAPAEHAGLSYFQAQWDPPMGARFEGDVPSAGLNYTVLGVGSRHGVNIQLAGCCIAVIGMIYAFYLKPVLRRRDRDRALAAARQRAADAGSDAPVPASRHPQPLVPVGASQYLEGTQP